MPRHHALEKTTNLQDWNAGYRIRAFDL
jgi:hypothetical protein